MLAVCLVAVGLPARVEPVASTVAPAAPPQVAAQSTAAAASRRVAVDAAPTPLEPAVDPGWWLEPVDAITRHLIRDATVRGAGLRVLRLRDGALLRIERGGASDGAATAHLAAAGYRSHDIVLPTEPADLGAIRMQPTTGSDVHLLVLDAASRPVDDASIRALTVDGDEVAIGTTAGDGRARLQLADRPHVLLARHRDQVSALVDCDPALDRAITLDLRPACLLHVRTDAAAAHEDALFLDLTAPRAGVPGRTLALRANGEARHTVAAGEWFVHARDRDGPREITAVGGAPVAAGRPVALSGGRTSVELGADGRTWVRLVDATTGQPIRRASVRVVFRPSTAAEARTAIDHGERERKDGRYLALPESARDLRSRVALELVVAAAGYRGVTVPLPAETSATLRLQPHAPCGTRHVVLRGREDLPVEAVAIQDADGQQLAAVAPYVPGTRIAIAWDGRPVHLELGTARLITLESRRFEAGADVTVDLSAITGALEVHAPDDLDPGRVHLECVSEATCFSPWILGQRTVFAYLPPGRVDVRLRGTSGASPPGGAELRDRVIVAGETTHARLMSRDLVVAAGRVDVAHDDPPPISAAPAWSDGLPLSDWHPAMGVAVRPDGSFRFRDLPAPPTHVVFYRSGERGFDPVILGVEPWAGGDHPYRLLLGDLVVEVDSRGDPPTAFRIGLQHAAVAPRLTTPTAHWQSRTGRGPIRFTAVPVGTAAILVPPHSGAAPSATAVTPRSTARASVTFR